ncbi:MAG TPA: hypothetical protein ENI76_08825 [Ignavibacteria bacterium]|nr:hypothetical protein [Ignavibacteria bacterium]
MINLNKIANKISSNDLSNNDELLNIINENGDKYYTLNGKIHRKNGPAVEYANGNKYWYVDDKCHREDGPAVECANGDKFWYLNGNEIEYDPETWDQVVKENKINNVMET